jgi:hypothetical protein
MDPAVFNELETTLAAGGPDAAIDHLCDRLREQKDYHSLFYALLLRKRHELGVSPVPTGPSSDLPTDLHGPYEDAIREAARRVGRLYLDAGNIPQAWPYFRMIGEPGPVSSALGDCEPADGDDLQPLVQIAFYEGVQPRKGFEWILGRYGICNAITTLSSQELPHPPEVRRWCIGRLVRALTRELCERLAAEIERREGSAPPPGQSVPQLIARRDWLFVDDFAHIDTSHLSAVVQMSTQLEPGEELELARELCVYGQKISPRLRYPGDPPFEDQYRDYAVYLAILAGENVEEGVAHFRAKAEAADPESVGAYPAVVLVNLLVKLGRMTEALAVSRKHLAGLDARNLPCPSLTELCQKTGDYLTLAEAAREQGDAVHFLAGLLAQKS